MKAHVKQSQARGPSQWLSMICLFEDKILLVIVSFPPFSFHFCAITTDPYTIFSVTDVYLSALRKRIEH